MKRKKGTGTKKDDQVEYRALGPRTEFRADDDDVLRGYAAVFDEEVEIFPGFREKIRKGAFKKTLKENPDIRALWNHDPNFVLGRTTNGTLKLKEDAHGLLVEIHPPETQWAKDDVETVRRGDVNQMSFAFRVIRCIWVDHEEDNSETREILEVRLYEVSPVTFPAYPTTEIALNQARGIHCGLCKCGKVGPIPGEDHSELALPEPDSPSDHPFGGAVRVHMSNGDIVHGTLSKWDQKVFSQYIPEPIQRGDEQDHSGDGEAEKETGVGNLTTATVRQKTTELLLRI